MAFGVFERDGGAVTVAVDDRSADVERIEQVPEVGDVPDERLLGTRRGVAVPGQRIRHQLLVVREGVQLRIRVP